MYNHVLLHTVHACVLLRNFCCSAQPGQFLSLATTTHKAFNDAVYYTWDGFGGADGIILCSETKLYTYIVFKC